MVKLPLDIHAISTRARFIISHPRDFYGQMPLTGGYAEPLAFCFTMGLASGLVAALFSLFVSGHLGKLGFGLVSVIVIPILAVAGCYIFTSIMFAAWKLMASRQDYEVSFRCVAYSFAVLPVSMVIVLVPYVGTLLTTIWWFWLMYICSTAIHKLGRDISMLVIGAMAGLVLLMNLTGEKSQRQFEARHNEFNQQMSELQNKQPEIE
jgi:hypothetical protein